MPGSANLTVQLWGNRLAVRIPAAIARSAGFKVGQPVEISAHDAEVRVAAKGELRLTLKQKLARFDPAQHSGEAIPTGRVGKELL